MVQTCLLRQGGGWGLGRCPGIVARGVSSGMLRKLVYKRTGFVFGGQPPSTRRIDPLPSISAARFSLPLSPPPSAWATTEEGYLLVFLLESQSQLDLSWPTLSASGENLALFSLGHEKARLRCASAIQSRPLSSLLESISIVSFPLHDSTLRPPSFFSQPHRSFHTQEQPCRFENGRPFHISSEEGSEL